MLQKLADGPGFQVFLELDLKRYPPARGACSNIVLNNTVVGDESVRYSRIIQLYSYPRAAPRHQACMKLHAACHAHAGCACVHGGSRIDPDANGRLKAFQRVVFQGALAPSSSGSWWPLSAPLCVTRAVLSRSTISKAHRQLVRRSILDRFGYWPAYIILTRLNSTIQGPNSLKMPPEE